MSYSTLKHPVSNRGVAPDKFLDELITWGEAAPEILFSPNLDPEDVFNRLAPLLGPWTSALHRRAAMLELLRVLAGFESSWEWTCGVDVTNASSLRNIEGQETGIFQVSFDSLRLDDAAGTGDDLHQCVMDYCGALDVHKFIAFMKTNHVFALEYGTRLLRNSFFWDGPIKRHEVDQWLRKDCVTEIQNLLA